MGGVVFYQKEDRRGIWAAYPQTFGVHPLSVITADKVLVLAPHPDDDVIGCGGLLAMLSAQKSNIKVIYFTDGARGNRNREYSIDLIEKREKETKAAGEILGIFDQKFLRLKHNELISSLELSALIRKEIEFDKPDLLLAPSLEEPHPDHLAVSEALARALSNYDGGLNIWLYEVFGTGRLNRLVDIYEFRKTKEEALSAHRSQVSNRKYEEAVLTLNRFRALSAGLPGYAECFYATGPRNYQKLFEFYSRHHETRY